MREQDIEMPECYGWKNARVDKDEGEEENENEENGMKRRTKRLMKGNRLCYSLQIFKHNGRRKKNLKTKRSRLPQGH
jgi:hypothetical protein